VVQTFRRIFEAPSATASFALRAVAAEWGLMLAACVAYVLALWVAVSFATVSFHSKLPDSAVSSLSWCISNVAVPLALGMWIARRDPGRSAPAILTLSAIHAGIDVLAALAIAALGAIGLRVHLDIILVLRVIDWASVSSALHSAAMYATLYPALLLAGALFSRPTSAALRT